MHFSVTWWTTLHQDGSVFNQKMQVHIHDARMNAALLLGVVAATLVYASLLVLFGLRRWGARGAT